MIDAIKTLIYDSRVKKPCVGAQIQSILNTLATQTFLLMDFKGGEMTRNHREARGAEDEDMVIR